ncbi:MAG: hypothetical protein HYS98_07870 [Deltaproteobacteria bacterium]|nr:hypothetical protein [Deltaproteobacteria bacterium]
MTHKDCELWDSNKTYNHRICSAWANEISFPDSEQQKLSTLDVPTNNEGANHWYIENGQLRLTYSSDLIELDRMDIKANMYATVVARARGYGYSFHVYPFRSDGSVYGNKELLHTITEEEFRDLIKKFIEIKGDQISATYISFPTSK